MKKNFEKRSYLTALTAPCLQSKLDKSSIFSVIGPSSLISAAFAISDTKGQKRSLKLFSVKIQTIRKLLF